MSGKSTPPAPDRAAGIGADLKQFMDAGMSYMPSRILTASLQLRVFSAMAGGARSAAEIASATGSDPRAMGMLLDALAALGFIAKTQGAYDLTPGAREFLVRESVNYVGHMMEDDSLWRSWGQLAEVVRTGKPVMELQGQRRAEEFFPILVRMLHVTNGGAARALAEALAPHRPTRVLDVACGSGIWGISVAEAAPDARVVFQDYPGVLDTTREFIHRHKLEARAEYLAGDLNDVDFGENQYDLILLGNILHSEGEESSRALLKKLGRAARPGGRCVIIEFVPNEERTGPPPAVFFALNMLVNTGRGGTFTFSEFAEWLRAAGFPLVESLEINSVSPAVIGVKS